MDKEVRSFNFTELRVSKKENEPKYITGMAAVYNRYSEYMGFVEIIEKNACQDALKRTEEIFCNIEHDNSLLLGKRSNGTLKIEETDEGLSVEIHPSDTSYTRDLMTNIDSGLVEGMSFAFSLPPEGGCSWDYDEDGREVRTIHKISRIYDTCVTCNPAYSDTQVACRDLESMKEEKNKLEEEELKEKEELKKIHNELDNMRERAEALSLGIIV